MLPYLIAGAIGFVVAKIFDEDEAPKYADGGSLDGLIIGNVYSGKKIRDIISNYGSQEGTDMNEFANDYIDLNDNYILGNVNVEKLIQNDVDLKSFISDEYDTNSNIPYSLIKEPILLGNGIYEQWKKNVVLDGYHRVLQALYNKDKNITAFIKSDSADKIISFEQGGLIAPNGKPSNLTPEQYKLVRTPEFKAWFGDWENEPENASKVVDSNGEPLVCYHGTKYDFTIFKMVDKVQSFNVRDYGSYFTDNKKTAQLYSLDYTKKKGNSKLAEKKYQKALNKYFKTKNEIDLSNARNLLKESSELSQYPLNSFVSKNILNCFLNLRNPLIFDGQGKLWSDVLQGKIDLALKNKNDGAIIKNIIEVDYIIQNTFITFEPEQIKLADGTNTTFDSNNPDIRFDEGGDTKWNLDRYREVEKEMYELWKQGKGDTTEYFKLIKEKTILEQAKTNQTNVIVLLAPNGKPSKLNKEQYDLVRTPAFKEWFGDWENSPKTSSKILDSNGEPLPVYHGTNAEPFVVFDGGSFFTDDYMNADGYASGEMVYEVFLNIKTPLIINARGRKWDNLKNKYGNSTGDIVGQLDTDKYDGVIFNNINDNWFDDEMGDTQNVYFSINPEQIKLADGTNTTFDSNNPDIRYADGGKLADNIFDYLIKEKGFSPLGKGFWGKSNCTIKIDFSNVLYQQNGDNRVWVSPIEYSDYKKAFTILEFHCKDKNKGIGTALLKEIIQGADLFGYTIFIEPTSMKKYRVETDINTNDLKEWYSKYDFKPLNDNYSDNVWLRNPNNPDIRYAGGGKIPNVNHKDIQGKQFTYDGGKFLIVDFPNKSGAWNKGASWRKTAKHHSYIIKLDDIKTNLDKSLFDEFNKPYYIYDDYWLQFNGNPCRSIQGTSTKLIDTLNYEIYKRENNPNNYNNEGGIR